MGDPRKQRKKYQGPAILWNKERIEDEKSILGEYGLKNKTEIWKVNSLLRRFTKDAKKLIKESSKQAEIEKLHLLKKLKSFGLLEQNAKLDEILGLKIRDILERRLQTRVLKKGLARSIKQSRQFITHEHIMVDDKIITSPSYLVPLASDELVRFCATSQLSNPEHSERIVLEKHTAKQKKEHKPKPTKKGGRKVK